MPSDDKYNSLLDKIYAVIPTQKKSDERFELPVFDSFIEGNKTIVKNFDLVCNTLRREKSLLIKYLSKELATPVVQEGDRVVLQRKVQPMAIGSKLKDFIKFYVICSVCGKPDTKISAGAGRVKELVCEACGARAPVV